MRFSSSGKHWKEQVQWTSRILVKVAASRNKRNLRSTYPWFSSGALQLFYKVAISPLLKLLRNPFPQKKLWRWNVGRIDDSITGFRVSNSLGERREKNRELRIESKSCFQLNLALVLPVILKLQLYYSMYISWCKIVGIRWKNDVNCNDWRD